MSHGEHNEKNFEGLTLLKLIRKKNILKKNLVILLALKARKMQPCWDGLLFYEVKDELKHSNSPPK